MGLELLLAFTLGSADLECLAKNIYFEARNQSLMGQLAVAHVVINRVQDDRYPNTICEVVEQGPTYVNWKGNIMQVRNKCQFSWYCDGLSDIPHNNILWEITQETAQQALVIYKNFGDLTNGSTHYHAANVNPYWVSELSKTIHIDDHIFYRWD